MMLHALVEGFGHRVLRQRTESDTQRSQRLTGEFLVCCHDLCATFPRQRYGLICDQLVRAARQEDVRRTFGHCPQAISALGIRMQLAHQLALG